MSFSVATSFNASLLYSDVGADICCPFFNKEGTLRLIMQNSGNIVSFSKTGQIEVIHNTGGQPNGGAYNQLGELYITDFAHGAVLAAHNTQDQQDIIVAAYEDKPLKGPNSIVSHQDSLFFTDSGPFGETGLHNAVGSIFSIINSPRGQILKPISLGNLAYPTGIAITTDGSYLFVAEMMANRILRFFQLPEGVYHGSVFYQMNGGVGPMSLAVDNSGYLYVGKYDFVGGGQQPSNGQILVLSKTAELLSTIYVPGPEISGLAINGRTLYITEKSTRSVYTASILPSKHKDSHF